MQLLRRTFAVLPLVAVSSLGLAACGKHANLTALSGDPITTTSPTAARPPTIAVTGVDYAFQGIPGTVAVGTTFTFKNGSTDEPHELVLFHLPDSETRSLAQLLQLPQDQIAAITGAPIGVAVAATPGGDGKVVDGALTVAAPGRYLALCTFAVGSNPATVEQMEKDHGGSGGPPTTMAPGTVLHDMKGMVQLFTAR